MNQYLDDFLKTTTKATTTTDINVILKTLKANMDYYILFPIKTALKTILLNLIQDTIL